MSRIRLRSKKEVYISANLSINRNFTGRDVLGNSIFIVTLLPIKTIIYIFWERLNGEKSFEMWQ